jgi:hypothetical protein
LYISAAHTVASSRPPAATGTLQCPGVLVSNAAHCFAAPEIRSHASVHSPLLSGVRDDNQARDAVVKRFLKEADTIWVVSHIGRAVNDKTAKVRGISQARPTGPGTACNVSTPSQVPQG